MSGLAIDSSTPFDSYASSLDADASQLQTYPALSGFPSVSIFDPVEDFSADFTSESAASPLSPLSPAHSSSSLGFTASDAWTNWDASAELSPEPDLFGYPMFTPCPPPDPSRSSAVNPMDLAATPFRRHSALSQSSRFVLPNMPAQQQRQTQQDVTSSPSPDAVLKRYPTREPKPKPTSSPSRSSASDEDEPPTSKPTHSPPETEKTASDLARAKAPRRSSHSNRKPSKDGVGSGVLGPKKSAHNLIEKRYRTNLNDKIAQLRDAVPALRVMAQQQQQQQQQHPHPHPQRSASFAISSPCSTTSPHGDETLGKWDFDYAHDDPEGPDEGAGAQPGGGGGSSSSSPSSQPKLNKATILSKATEYIQQLERRNQGLETENSALRGRMEGLEVLLLGAGAAVGGRVSPAAGFVAGWT